MLLVLRGTTRAAGKQWFDAGEGIISIRTVNRQIRSSGRINNTIGMLREIDRSIFNSYVCLMVGVIVRGAIDSSCTPGVNLHTMSKSSPTMETAKTSSVDLCDSVTIKVRKANQKTT